MPIKTISNKPYTIAEYLRKLAKYGFLIAVLSKREFKVKYSRTLLGIGWFFLQPLLVVIVYNLFFNTIIHIDTGSIPYTSFVFSGLTLWYLFTGIVSRGSYSLVESSELINKVPFPRFIILIAKIVPVVLECAVLMLILFVLTITHHAPGLSAFTALFYFLQTGIFSLALGLFFSAIVVRYRDLAHVIPYIVNFGIWLTPVFYPLAIVPQPYRHLITLLNPLAASIEGLRGALFFNTGISGNSWLIFLFSGLLLLLSFYYFIKFEKNIVENL